MPVTLKDIATRCGLAVSTVSNILNDNKDSYASARVKKLVKDTAEELGYRKHYLSVSLRTRKTLSIGLCIDHIVYETRRYFLDAFVEAFNKKGYEVAITTHEMDPDRALASLRFFQERFKDGIVLFTDFLRDIGPHHEKLATELSRSPVKVLGVGSELRGVVPSIDIERAWALRDCISRLRKNGHRSIVLVYKTPADFRDALPTFREPDCVHMDNVYTAEDFRSRWPALREAHPDATAVFFRSDEIAIPALAWFAANGVAVPDELSVAGFDHFRFSEYTSPPLTTYDINFAKLGHLAFERLYRWIRGRTPLDTAYYRTIRPTFIERQSHTRTRTKRKRS